VEVFFNMPEEISENRRASGDATGHVVRVEESQRLQEYLLPLIPGA
jgi:hypothetical protein